MKPPAAGALLLGAILLAQPGRAPGFPPAPAGDSAGPPVRAVATWPAHGDPAVLTDPVVVRFSRPVALSTATEGTFRVARDGSPVPGTFAAGVDPRGDPDPRVAVFTPHLPLPADAACSVYLTTGITGVLGRPLREPVRFSFRTSPYKDPGAITLPGPLDRPRRLPRLGPAPRVVWTSPPAGLGSVYTDEVVVRFSRPMDGASLGPGTFGVTQGSVPVPGTVSFAPAGDGREVLFSPERPLFRNSHFEILVTREARSERGRFLREEFRAGFGTSPFKDGVQPLRPEDFQDGPPMHEGRAFHTACGLNGGDVLLAGGQDLGGAPRASAEVFRRSVTAFERVGDMATDRRKHAATTLRDGRVLVCGGFGPVGTTLSSAEVYDPASKSWAAAPSMAESRANHTATLLPTGRVLVVGGYSTDSGGLSYAATAEIYDPIFNLWSAAAVPVAERGGHTATLLPDGRVLLAGGVKFGYAVAEIYDPAKGTFTRTGSDPLEDRVFHAAAVTKYGTVLLAAGGPARAETYDPAADSFASAGSCPPFGLPVSDGPYYASLTAIPGYGRVALLGGLSVGGGGGGSSLVLEQVQVWSGTGGGGAGAFYPMLFTMGVPRAAHTVTSLGDGRYLVAGGLGTDGVENERRTTIFLPSQ